MASLSAFDLWSRWRPACTCSMCTWLPPEQQYTGPLSLAASHDTATSVLVHCMLALSSLAGHTQLAMSFDMTITSKAKASSGMQVLSTESTACSFCNRPGDLPLGQKDDPPSDAPKNPYGSEPIPIRACTFEAPRVGNQLYAQAFSDMTKVPELSMVRIVNRLDLVPEVRQLP